MVIRNVSLETVCGITSTIPDNPYGEVAFAGKSNVGKSSMINALMNRKALARTSSQPGKTQTINFYNINDALYFVDLPGYGYANAGVEIKAKWGQMIENYLHVSKQLRAVFLLIDIRHDPSDNDRMMYDWMLHQGFAPIIIATKADKLKRSQLAAHLGAIREGLSMDADATVIPFSAETKQGRDEIWELIDSLVLPEEDSRGGQSVSFAGKADARKRVSGNKTGAASGNAAGTAANETSAAGENPAPEKVRKPRWKDTDRPVAKKTLKKANAKKAKAKNRK
jgi:GTP-binding protein